MRVSFELDLTKLEQLADLTPANVSGIAKQLLLQWYHATYQQQTPASEIATQLDRHHSRLRELVDRAVASSDTALQDMTRTTKELFGLAKASSTRGVASQNAFFEGFRSNVPDYAIQDMSTTPHAGDFHVTSPQGFSMMMELKNYSKPVDSKEIEKMKGDMVATSIRHGILLSIDSGIVYRPSLDVEVFERGGVTYTIVYLSNFQYDYSRLRLALLLLEGLRRAEPQGGLAAQQLASLRDRLRANFEQLQQGVAAYAALRERYAGLQKTVCGQLDEFGRMLLEEDSRMRRRVADIIADVREMDKNAQNADASTECDLSSYSADPNFASLCRLEQAVRASGACLKRGDGRTLTIVRRGVDVALARSKRDHVELAWQAPVVTIRLPSKSADPELRVVETLLARENAGIV